MAIRAQSERRFGRSSPVARYWLAQCEGFRVQGPVKGTVEEIVGSVDPQSAERLIVRRAWRRRTVSVATIDAVVPAARLIVVDGRPRTTRHPLVDAARALVLVVAAVVAALAHVLLRATQLSAVGTARFVAHARARLQAAAAERRRTSFRRPRSSPANDRRLTRAAVLGVDRRGGQKP
jgi:hypothetical protein